MAPSDTLNGDSLFGEDSFRFIKPEEFQVMGIDPEDILPGTFPALKHPSHLPSRFGGNAYGLGVFELQSRLKPKDFKILQGISFKSQGDLRRWHREINRIYKEIGLLIRYSSRGEAYYLIPSHLVSNTLSRIRYKVEEISKIISHHGKKFFKEQHVIGLLTSRDDLIIEELSYRFKEHRFVTLDSLENLRHLKETLDLAIVTRDPYELLMLENFSPLANRPVSRKRLDQYVTYTLCKLYKVLKAEGELFIIANHYTPKTHRSLTLGFKTELEEKSFALFTHIFKTRKKYRIEGPTLDVNLFDFQSYLRGLFVEKEVLDRLLGGRSPEEISLQEIESLPYRNFPLEAHPIRGAQEDIWPGLLSTFFDEIFLKPLVPGPVVDDWASRFSCSDCSPQYMIIYLGQKRPLKTTYSELRREVMASQLAGCVPDFLAEYRNTFEYVIRTLQVIGRLKAEEVYAKIPQIFVDRLTQPLENKNRRFAAVNDVMRLVRKTGRLRKAQDLLNPDRVEGPETKVLENLEALTFLGFTFNELREIFLIVLGHTAMGRIVAGKMNEKALKPITEVARGYSTQQAINLLRYCRLMTMAEVEASWGARLTPEHLGELFDLYESTVRVTVNRDFDWDKLMDEKTAAMGGIKNTIVRKLIKMINHIEYVDHWADLKDKGKREKEALADYDEVQLRKIENVLQLVETLEVFEEHYLKGDPLRSPAFYRKLFDTEFHGTAHIFEKMDSKLVFVLLWIATNVSRGDVINFNPLLKDVTPEEVEGRMANIETEARSVNVRYLDLEILRELGAQVYRDGSASIVGTGFQLKIDPKTRALEIGYTDITGDIEDLDTLTTRLAGGPLHEIPPEDIQRIETLFSDLEGFYRSHMSLVLKAGPSLRLPERQKRWFETAQALRERLREVMAAAVLSSDDIYDRLSLLQSHAPTLVSFVFPEFGALRSADLIGHPYLETSLTNYVLDCLKKIQALIRRDRAALQDIALLHRLAQREFGPMATGIVGMNETQVGTLEEIMASLKDRGALYRATLACFLFQNLGDVPELRKKHEGRIHPASLGRASAFLLEEEKIAERYHLAGEVKPLLLFLVRFHAHLRQMVRGELPFAAIQEVLESGDRQLFDAFFLTSFIAFAAVREDLMIEDLAARLFLIRAVGHRVIGGKATLGSTLNDLYHEKGKLSYGLESRNEAGSSNQTSNADGPEETPVRNRDLSEYIGEGRRIFALERVFRLSGIRFVEFGDLCNLMGRVPLRYIYQNRGFASIGYATFEREVYEAFRIYNTLGQFPAPAREFILGELVENKIRITGYEQVSHYLSYENQMKLILIALLRSQELDSGDSPITLNFFPMARKIQKRYEAVNDDLNTFTPVQIWEQRDQLGLFFKPYAGLLMKRELFPGVLSIDFRDRIDMARRIGHMATITQADQLKNYFHFSLRSLRKHPFATDDYQLELEKAYERRLGEINDLMVLQVQRQMDLLHDFKELHDLMKDLTDRSLELGLTEAQKQRLRDIYELRKDALKRAKLLEIERILAATHDAHELEDYWSSIKEYLQAQRPYLGKDFETLIARKFDQAALAL
jgi:hypothetical protein